ncbi:MAG: 3-methyl-2-oxobutanoate dehydrogenase subunit VorB [Oscillospiraceae bacterium]|nr:3-methyl-2-oxobutanoate dehydrogenase subunit VorB [Oscillospiraceae bacterium]
MKGCEAIAEAAVRAGCRFYAGYPITPQNEIPEYMSRRLPQVGGVFVQGESEIASVNMVYGAGAGGTRSMTSSSSVGISLKSEGISYCAGAMVPMVYANMQRGGPGVGTIQASQQDYFQATKASGNGGFKMIVLAPATVQEAVDMTYQAFDLAERDRNPVLILGDGVIGTIMEPVVLPPMKSDEEVAALKQANRKWAIVGHSRDEKRGFLSPGYWSTVMQEEHCIQLDKMYHGWEENDVQVEELYLDNAELVFVAYGTTARIAKSALELLRAEGHKVGMIRPKTVSPFPVKSFDKINYDVCKCVLDIEMSIPAQMLYDVKLAVKERGAVDTCLRSGGNLIERGDIVRKAQEILSGGVK